MIKDAMDSTICQFKPFVKGGIVSTNCQFKKIFKGIIASTNYSFETKKLYSTPTSKCL